MNIEELFGAPIHVYSRAQGIMDGVLVNVSEMAKEAGFIFPVALTRAAFESCVVVPKGVMMQDETGRLWDVLHMLRMACKRGGQTMLFKLYVKNSNRSGMGKLTTLKAVCGPGDNHEPVITVMLPEED